MPYVDGFVLPIPKKNVEAYRRIAKQGGKIWRKYGALEYWECVGDDLDAEMGGTFRQQLKLKPNETVVFAWIMYKSRAHRDRVNKKVLADPSMAPDKQPAMPFDMKRMAWGGFKPIVKA